MNKPVDLIEFSLNGRPAAAAPGETILQVAKRSGVRIPHLCYSENLRPDGNCRACVVEVAGERVLAPSCCRAVTPGLDVQTRSERATKSQQMVLEMLLADLPAQGYKWNDGPADAVQGDAKSHTPGQHGELSAWADELGVTPRASLVALRREAPAPDLSHALRARLPRGTSQ